MCMTVLEFSSNTFLSEKLSMLWMRRGKTMEQFVLLCLD